MKTIVQSLKAGLNKNQIKSLNIINDDRKKAWSSFFVTLKYMEFTAQYIINDILNKNENSKEAINTLLQKNEIDCPICFDSIRNNLYISKCHHIFHDDCIKKLVNNKCPMCRGNLECLFKSD